jgi:hypothetical protein
VDDDGSGTARPSDSSLDTGQGRSPVPPPYRAAIVVITLALVMGAAFTLSYTIALGRPRPRDIPVAVVGGTSAPVLEALQARTGGGLDLRSFPTLTAARAAVNDRRVYAVLETQRAPPRLYVSSASGASVARALEQLVQAPPRPLNVSVADLHPLPPSDPQGLTAFYVTIAATLVGFVTVFQLRANASGIGLRPWLVLIAVLAVCGGAVLTFVADTLLGALKGPFAELWPILSAHIAIAALFNSAMLVLVGRWAIVPTWTLFIVLGNTSCGGAVAPPLLPAFLALVGRWLPHGATVSALNAAVYFPAHQHPEPFLVLAGWLVGVGTLLVAASRRRGRSPAQ